MKTRIINVHNNRQVVWISCLRNIPSSGRYKKINKTTKLAETIPENRSVIMILLERSYLWDIIQFYILRPLREWLLRRSVRDCAGARDTLPSSGLLLGMWIRFIYIFIMESNINSFVLCNCSSGLFRLFSRWAISHSL